MRRSHRWLLIGVGAALVATLVPVAAAQTGRRTAAINRPSDQGPSARDTRTGGYYTRVGTEAQTNTVDVATAPQALGLPSRPRSVGTYEPQRLGPPVQLSHLPTVSRSAFLGRLDPGLFYDASQFTMSTSVDTPLGGWGMLNVLPVPVSFVLPSALDRNRFQEVFGLNPAEPPQVSQPAPSDTVWRALERGTELKLSQTEEQARALFRMATARGTSPDDQQRHFRRAIVLLDNVRRLDRQAFVPCLLLVHASLAEAHMASAINCLLVAAQRNPAAFREGPKIASYFGDYDEQTGRSAYLDVQMRLALQSSSTTPTIEGLALEAYCAWALEDKPRCRAALDKAQELLLRNPHIVQDVDKLLDALRYAQ